MSLFKRKKGDFIDLRGNSINVKKINNKNPRLNSFNSPSSNFKNNSSSSHENSEGVFGIFGSADVASTANQNSSSDYVGLGVSGNSNSLGEDSSEDRRKKLTKRIMDMTDRLEELSNQMYKLQQRVELLERKTDLGRGY